jgi:hypothetical protein
MAWPKNLTFLDRFWNKVDFNGPIHPHNPALGRCWLWMAYKDDFGRGQFWTGRKLVHAHTVAWELNGSPVPEGMSLLHSCDNMGCLNPDHCRLGTQLENIAEMIARGRANQHGRFRSGIPRTPKRDHVPTLEERFWAKVNKNGPVPKHCPDLGPCWIWTARGNQCGYGLFGIGGSSNCMVAHKVHWAIIAKREIPEGMELLHRCDNPPCVRLEHLRTGTHAENMADMTKKGRAAHLRGNKTGAARHLSLSQAAEAKDMLDAGCPHKEIMEKFGISRTAVSRIARGITYKEFSRN